LQRVVVAVDPSGTSGEESDECGVVVVGRDDRKPAHFYVMADLSLRASPDAWARKAIVAYHAWHADRVVGEANFGGDMIESVLRHIDENVSYKKVTASRGKLIRAEPVAALYEQHRVHHVGAFTELEEQMVNFVPGSAGSPDRMDALVWGIHELSEDSNGFFGWLQRCSREKEQQAHEQLDMTMPMPAGAIAGTIVVNGPRNDHEGNPISAEEAARRGGLVAVASGNPPFRFEDPHGALKRPARLRSSRDGQLRSRL